MASESKFIKTKSNYVLRDKHQTINKGTVFERDFMTISGSDGMSPDEEQMYGLSNFKFVVRSGINQQKKHTNGRWINEKEVLSGETNTEISTDTKITFNPDYESVKDFAYYGSAVNLIKATVVNIIHKFPAEIYFTKEEFKASNGTTYYKVGNDFDIDIITEVIEPGTVENETRYMAVNYADYQVIYDRGIAQACLGALQVTHFDNPCDAFDKGAIIATVVIGIMRNGTTPTEFTITVYRVDDTIYLLYSRNDSWLADDGYRIRPNSEIIDRYFNEEADDFSKVLLNRDSVPVYTATFNTPFEAESGYFTYRKKYTWPSAMGWNPDINTMGFENYINELIELATFHDEYDSDNIWRSMTHEAIKNLDWTFTKVEGELVDEMDSIDTTKVEPVLKIYGRQYDDIKRTIDVIGKSQKVTYDNKNNIPDYFLDDTLELSGWETRSVQPTTDNRYESPELYPGSKNRYTANDANDEFMRRLKINSPYIFSMKGTKRGLVTMLGLFGYEEGTDYDINEYIVIAGGDINYDEVAGHNETKHNFMASENDPLYGLPLIGIDNGTKRYVTPWFEKGKKYDDNTYFQMKGGWGKMEGKPIDLTALTPTNFIVSSDEYTLYDETISDLKLVATLDDMLELGRSVVRTGDICYVTNISLLNEKYNNQVGNEDNIGDASHYFLLVNDDFADKLGYVDSVEDSEYQGETFGWKIITNSEICAATTSTALRVLHLESIIDDTTGNNPHMGHSKYDFGQSYIENMLKPFLPTYKNKNFIMYDDASADTVTNEECAFTAVSGYYTVDNQKCWYFTDGYPEPNSDCMGESVYTAPKLCELNGFNSVHPTHTKKVNAGETGETGTASMTSITPYNFDTNSSSPKNSEGAANSIINTKRLTIDFHLANLNDDAKEEMRNYIVDKVLFYLKQLIPATTLFEYTIS